MIDTGFPKMMIRTKKVLNDIFVVPACLRRKGSMQLQSGSQFARSWKKR